jgi:hypothetical protein
MIVAGNWSTSLMAASSSVKAFCSAAGILSHWPVKNAPVAVLTEATKAASDPSVDAMVK